jgi:hypothetical protein
MLREFEHASQDRNVHNATCHSVQSTEAPTQQPTAPGDKTIQHAEGLIAFYCFSVCKITAVKFVSSESQTHVLANLGGI